MPSYTVKEGECLANIASRNGMAWKTIWEHADNKDLRDLRKNPNVLHVGDVVVIPDKHQKQAPAAVNAKHNFTVKRPEAKLRLRVLSAGKAVSGAPYTVTVDGVPVDPGKPTKTDGDGLVVAKIHPEAKTAVVTLTDKKVTYKISLGHLDPTTKKTGLQARLHALGYYPGDPEGDDDVLLSVALWLFQCKSDLTPTGTINDDTVAALEKAYGM